MDQLQFLFRIDSIAPDYDVQPEDRAGDLNWRPPSIRQAIKTNNTTHWYRWTASGIFYIGPIAGGIDHDVCSLFYNSESSQFLGVPFDCRIASVEDNIKKKDGVGWRRLMFRHRTITFKNTCHPLSIVRLVDKSHVLASRTNPYWMPQLLPSSFKNNDYGPLINGVELDTCLTGNLTLMIALAAFSAPEYYMIDAIRSCFKPPYWGLHQFGEDSECFHPFRRFLDDQDNLTNFLFKGEHGRGMVVYIRTDPGAPAITGKVLEDFEAGVYGPMVG